MVMTDVVQHSAFESPTSLGLTALIFVLYLLLGIVPTCAFLYLVYFLITLPLRRKHRARLFVDILESGINEGQTPEQSIVHASNSRDPLLSRRFHQVAGLVERGYRLSQALAQVPGLVYPEMTAMLRVGERIADTRSVLPACRKMLGDGLSQVRGALNYLILILFAMTPVMVVLPALIRIRILPVFSAVFGETPLPWISRLVLSGGFLFSEFELLVLLLLWVLVVAFIGGPRLGRWFFFPELLQRLQFSFPWRRKRMQRDFSGMLSLLLDAHVPEPEALALAGESTGNIVMARRAARAQNLLKNGSTLPQALKVMDDTGEFQWRLRNAIHGPDGFGRALAGWHEALDARAFQLEQAAAQTLTTGIVLFNGLVVGTIIVGIFAALIELINRSAL
jgi:type IV pilus assembly protein PilC